MKILLEFWPITFFLAKRGTGLLEVLPYLSHALYSELQSLTLTRLETVMTVMRGKIRAFSTHRRSFISGFFHITNPFVEAFNFLPMFFAISDCMIRKVLEKLFIFFFRLSLKYSEMFIRGLYDEIMFFSCASACKELRSISLIGKTETKQAKLNNEGQQQWLDLKKFTSITSDELEKFWRMTSWLLRNQLKRLNKLTISR